MLQLTIEPLELTTVVTVARLNARLGIIIALYRETRTVDRFGFLLVLAYCTLFC